MKPYMKANLLAARTFLAFVEDCNARTGRYVPVGKRHRNPKAGDLPPSWEADFLHDHYPLMPTFVRIIFQSADWTSRPPSVRVIDGGDIAFFKTFEYEHQLNRGQDR